jgi:hypothetical protein
MKSHIKIDKISFIEELKKEFNQFLPEHYRHFY